MGDVSMMKDELMDTSSTSAPPQPTGVTYTIGGVKVEFPAKAYPSQVSMMDKIIRGCHRAQNCLLESPTGSGKTLALLCGALAWQKAESERADEINAKNLMEYRQKEIEWRQKHDEILKKMSANQKPVTAESSLNEPPTPPVDVKNIENIIILGTPDEDEDDIFRKCSLPKKMKMDGDCSSFPLAESSANTLIENHGTNKKEAFAINEEVKGEKIPGTPAPPKEIKVPKIYFGTRTHKQIAQVVHELRRTAYNNVNITILSSRTHSCIMDDKYGSYQNKTELCNELLDPRRGAGCRYKLNVKSFRHHNLIPASELPSIWDLEDLIKFGRKRMACPYFVARELKAFSSVIFCPYNYLIDPLIRKSMDINLKGDILILDEAHNIEDTCRESASFTIQQRQVQDAMKECEEIANQTQFSEPYRDLALMFQSLSLWIDQYKNSVNDVSDYDKGQLTFFGPEAVKLFDDYEFGKNNFGKLELALKQIDAIKAENDEEDTIAAVTKNLAEGLRLILGLLYDDRYTCDYHVVLTKNFAHHSQEEPSADDSGWFNRRKKTKTVQGWQYSLHFWCFNPATIFCDIKEDCRSIILTSGTLAPMDSFQSELGALFPITLEANHVIDPSQCWVGSLGFGPSNVLLDGTYKSTSTYQFQDEIGRILLKICSVVPHGVLCFVPSYTLLEKLRDRWNFTKLIEEIEQHKEVAWEPRRANELDELLSRFYRTIEETSNNVVGESVTGVLFLAVCRGKVSEGLDFADKNARTVVTIGIPFPNVKDSQVILKKSYNDKHQHTKGLLNGRDWYQIQAFRALNQALGRCIRHRRDWGAILLLDSRFSNEHYCKGLSKWVRNKVRHHPGFQGMVNHLSTFIQTRLQIEQNENITCP